MTPGPPIFIPQNKWQPKNKRGCIGCLYYTLAVAFFIGAGVVVYLWWRGGVIFTH